MISDVLLEQSKCSDHFRLTNVFKSRGAAPVPENCGSERWLFGHLLDDVRGGGVAQAMGTDRITEQRKRPVRAAVQQPAVLA